MGHVILLILKILGIVLLVLLGVVLLVLATVLFVPVRYCLKVSGNGTYTAIGGFRWLLGILNVPIVYEEGEFRASFKVFGFTVKDFSKQEESTSAAMRNETVSDPADASEENVEESVSTEDVQPLQGNSSETRQSRTKEGLLRGIILRISEKIKKLKYTIVSFYDKIKTAIKKAGSVKNFVSQQSTRDALGACMGQLIYLLGKIKPKHVKGFIHFGMDDPAMTGQILGAVAVVGGYIPRKLRVIPDFEQQIFELDLKVKGHLHFITAVWILIRLLLDKNVKTAYKKIKSGL